MIGVDTSLLLWLRGLIFCVTWREKKGFSSALDANRFAPDKHSIRRNMVFIRHGESDWNEVFNKEKYLLLPRLFFGLLREFTKCFHGQDSVFLDSPLSLEGCDQADELRDFLFNTGDPKKNISVRMAREGTPDDSIVVASNLRRAIHTGLIGLYPRLERNNNEKILLRAELQEMSRNVDTGSITGKGQIPVVDVVDKRIGKSSSKWLDPSQNAGNKKMCTSAKPRFDAFCKWVCEQEKENVIVAAGHSLWFREFFKLYLPKQSTHTAKKDKMLNCASVSFELYQTKASDGTTGWCVKETTIQADYLGFKTSSKKSKKKMIMGFVGASVVVGLIAMCLQMDVITMSGMINHMCTSGIAGLRGGSVMFVVASLGAAGMYTCVGKAPGKLLAVAFYAFVLYSIAVYAPSWFECGAAAGVGGSSGSSGSSGAANPARVIAAVVQTVEQAGEN